MSSHNEHDQVSRREFLEFSGSMAVLTAAGALVSAAPACSDASKKIRLGVVGGNFGLEFPFELHPNCLVTAVTDLDEARRKRLEKKHPRAASYPSLEAMLKRDRNLDAVALFSGAPSHVLHTTMCFARGLHVLCAVPACMTLEEAADLKAAKQRTGLRYMMAETSYYRSGCILARNLYKQGGFGELFYTEAEYYHDKGDLQALNTNKTTRFWNRNGSPSWRWGFPPLMYSTHATSYLVGVTKERVRKVSALGWGTKHPFLTRNQYKNPHWNETALMATDKGHALRCNVFWLVGADGERAQWFGDNSSLLMANEGRHGPLQHTRMAPARPIAMPEYWNTALLPEALRVRSPHGDSHPFIINEFINALIQDREPAIDVYEALAMTVPGIVGYQSALKDGEQLTVPSFDLT